MVRCSPLVWTSSVPGGGHRWRGEETGVGLPRLLFPELSPPPQCLAETCRSPAPPVMRALPLLQDGGCQPHTLSGQGHSAKGSGLLV